MNKMKCNICGENYTEPSFGGDGVCGRCDCGIKPNGENLTTDESLRIAERYKKGLVPYFKPNHCQKNEQKIHNSP